MLVGLLHQDRKRFDLETLFAHVEAAAAPVLKSLVQGERLVPDDREHFALFLGLATVRTPAAIADAGSAYAELVKARSRLQLTDPETVLNHLRKMNGGTGEEATLRSQAEGVARMAREDSYDVKVDEGFALTRSLKVWHVVARELFDKDWVVVHARDGDEDFVTTDSPVVLMSKSTEMRDLPIGFGSEHAQILFPLSPRTALVMSGSAGRTARAGMKIGAMHRFNLTVAGDCHRFVIGGDADQLTKIVSELDLANASWRPKSSVEIGQRAEADGTVKSGVWIKRSGA